MSQLPHFLVIGAMKAGTTSLYKDLLSQPPIYFPPAQKEPESLVDDGVLTAEGRRAYARLYRSAASGQICGDASTAYTKRPDIEGVARRARRLLGDGVKAIYIVREPLARSVSHHYHEFVRASMAGSFDDALRRYPRLVDYSRYAFQLRPWLDALGPERVRVVRFEDYVRDRKAVVASLSHFLGVDPEPERIDTDRAYNRREQLRVPKGTAWSLSRSALYCRLLRPVLPRGTREWLQQTLLPAPPPPPAPPSGETLRRLADRLAPDVEELQGMLDLAAPPWDLEQALRDHLEAQTGAEQTGNGDLPRRATSV